jgi:hypothetical protein
VLLHQAGQQAEAVGQAGETLQPHGRFGQPDGDLDILGALGQDAARQVLDALPFRQRGLGLIL